MIGSPDRLNARIEHLRRAGLQYLVLGPVTDDPKQTVLLAALEALADPAFTLHGAITSTGGSATLVVVNGPIRRRLEFNSGANVFGPGWGANATVGRAIRLVTLNCLGAQPGVLDKSSAETRSTPSWLSPTPSGA